MDRIAIKGLKTVVIDNGSGYDAYDDNLAQLR